MLRYRVYMETGKIQETGVKRTAPLNFAEALVAMSKLSFQVPLAFFIGFIPRSIGGVVSSAVNPIAIGRFLDAAQKGDKAMAINAIIIFCIVLIVGPLINLCANFTETYYTTKMISACRHKMLRSTLKGGTEFGERFRPGKLIDSFSGQLGQVEIYSITYFIGIIPQLCQIVSGVVATASVYPPAVYLFISLVPVIASVDYFDDRASRASGRKADTDAEFLGKVNSAVECRDAIRAANASEWVKKDMSELLDTTDKAHFTSFVRSGLSQSYTEIVSSIFTVMVVLPLGMAIINGQLDLGAFGTAQAALVSEMLGLASLWSSSLLL